MVNRYLDRQTNEMILRSSQSNTNLSMTISCITNNEGNVREATLKQIWEDLSMADVS